MTSRPGLWARGPLDDASAVVVALAAVGGALLAWEVPVPVGLVACVLAVLLRRALLVALAAALLAAGLGAAALDGLTPQPAAAFEAVATLVSDPRESTRGWQAEVRTAQGRLLLDAAGAPGGRLSTQRAGERVLVRGRTGPAPDGSWAVARHLRGRLVADHLEPVDEGGPLSRAVNRLRGLVVDGASSLPPASRALFLGFVLGDDRGMPPEVADDFDASGLTHLLVVSGQNVVFVLAVAAPLTGRLPRRPRFALVVGVLLLFAAVTRFEPSVLRATAMAGVGATAALLGRPVAGIRVLALAVTGLVLVDPLLVRSLGFGLSVAASTGILLLATPLATVLPGPRALRDGAAVCLAAQAGVAPLVVPTLGPLPVAALPANVLADPVAGVVMMWGCTGGLVAGVVPAPVATILHLPTRAGLWWVTTVARLAAQAPLGSVGLVGVAVAVGAFACAVVLRRRGRWRGATAVALLTVVGLALGPLLVAPPGGATGEASVGGARLWRGGGPAPATILVIPGDAHAPGVLAGLREQGVARLDLVVLRSPGRRAAEVLEVVRRRFEVVEAWAPVDSPAPHVGEPPEVPVEAGGLRIVCRSVGDRLDVEVALWTTSSPTVGAGRRGRAPG